MAQTELTGITVLEAPSAEATISTDPEPICAFIGRAPSGPVNEAVLVSSMAMFEREFGGHWPGSTLGLSLSQFFQHGGRRAYVVRVANAATPGRVRLAAESGQLTLIAVNAGSRERIRASVDYDDIAPDSDGFNLTVQRMDYTNGRIADQELYRNVSARRDARRYVGRVLDVSRLVRLAPAQGELSRPLPMSATLTNPSIGYAEMSEFGEDGVALTDYDLVGSDRQRSGLFALEAVESFDFLYACGDHGLSAAGAAFLVAAERYCARRNAMLIVDPPADGSHPLSTAGNVGLRRELGGAALSYYPALRRRHTEPGELAPAAGALAGLLCRQDERNDVWSPLADDLRQNSAALHRDWVGASTLETDEALRLLRAGVNPLLSGTQNRLLFPGLVTCANASDRERGSLPRQRLRQFVLGRIERATRWAAFAPATERTWRQVEQQVADFLGTLAARGAFEVDAEAAWQVRCDADTNAESGGEGVRLLIGYRPRGAREPAMYSIVQHRDGTSACRAAFRYSEP